MMALGQHLSTCAACRRVEDSYRGVGAMVRQLPSIVPPPSLRDAVFAAIHAEEARLLQSASAPGGRPRHGTHADSPAERLARAETNPGLPVVRARPVTHVSERRRALGSVRMVAAIAAVLLLAISAARVLPALSPQALGTAVTNLLGGTQHNAPIVAQYTPNGSYPRVSGALASDTWLVYSATSGTGGAMLFAHNRYSQQEVALLPAPLQMPLHLRAMTTSWVLWSAGTNATSARWALYATRLPGTSTRGSAPVTLLDSTTIGTGAPALLSGVWAQGTMVLAAVVTRDGTAELLRIDLATGGAVSRVIAHAQGTGHLLADPSAASGAYYWADVWSDAATGLHSAIWQSDDAGHAHTVLADDQAFHPLASGGVLAWVEVRAPAAASGADAVYAALRSLHGALDARPLQGGQQRQIAADALATSLQGQGSLLLWRTGAQAHTYDLRTHAPSLVDSQVRNTSYAAAGAATITWGQGAASGPIMVYDIP